jgi:hypothetical protein
MKRDWKDWTITKERVEANNSCARTLIFSSSSFIAFFVKHFLFICPFSHFYISVFIAFFTFLFSFFIALRFPLLFHPCFVSVFSV